jgi:hypothetical protein
LLRLATEQQEENVLPSLGDDGAGGENDGAGGEKDASGDLQYEMSDHHTGV